ncbi:MAG: hypothetical protein ACOC47_00195 [Alkalispirochaetaceae bacterium]
MNAVLLPTLIISFAFALGYGFMQGQRKNRLIAAEVAHSLEELYRPDDTRYVNIGGVVGYHIFYQLHGKVKSIVGTLTLLPRHAVLYMPISRLLGRRDQMRLTLHTTALPFGEGHIVDPGALEKGILYLEDQESLQRRSVSLGERSFLILYRNPMVADRLERFFAALPTVEGLHSFSLSRMERSYSVVADPTPESLIPLIEGVQENLTLLELGY